MANKLSDLSHKFRLEFLKVVTYSKTSPTSCVIHVQPMSKMMSSLSFAHPLGQRPTSLLISGAID